MYFGATGRLSRDASKWATKILPALASFTSNCDSSLVCQNKTRQAGGGGALVNGFCKTCQDTFELGREESTKTKVYLFKLFIKSWNNWLETVAQSPFEQWQKIPFPLRKTQPAQRKHLISFFHSLQLFVKPRYTAAVLAQFLAIIHNFFLKLTKLN